jgi:hypothetical protein
VRVRIRIRVTVRVRVGIRVIRVNARGGMRFKVKGILCGVMKM